ncbi:sulfur carrier protein ThiS [bacterium SCSIO 12696]|nr:sulfur carrier protein ThiS [bacterium SCSIO 12696]
MKISINGESRDFTDNTPLPELLTQYGAVEPYVVAINETFIPKPQYSQVTLADGDSIDVVRPIQGG